MIKDVRASLPQVKTPADARRLGAALARRWTDAKIRKVITAAGLSVESAGSRPWSMLVQRLPRGRRDRMDAAFDGRKLVDQWTKDAFALIKSVRSEVAEGLRADVVGALEVGTPIDDLRRKWLTKGIPVEFGTMEGRIKTIARHQLTLLNSRVQRARAEQVGVTEFIWHKNTDRHAEFDGRIFKYKTGAPGGVGLPGEPINCQCWAESIIPDKLAKELGLP